MKVWIAKVIPFASIPVLNFPYSAQSGVKRKSITPRIARGTERKANRMMNKTRLL